MLFNSVTSLYFSPTGTTKKVVDCLVEVIAPKEHFRIILNSHINIFEEKKIKELNDIIILAVPVYEEHIPDHIKKILSSVNFCGNPIIVIAVYGNIGYGISLSELHELAISGNGIPVGALACIGEHSYCLNSSGPGFGRPNENDLLAISQYMKTLLSYLEKYNLNEFKLEVKGSLPLSARILPRHFAKYLVKPPGINNFCVKCGACIKICPMGAIDKQLSIDSKICLRCLACVKICPFKGRDVEFRFQFLMKTFFFFHTAPKNIEFFYQKISKHDT